MRKSSKELSMHKITTKAEVGNLTVNAGRAILK